MRTVIALALAVTLNTALHANVIGPNKDGIYKVDQWGAPKETKKKTVKFSDTPDYFTIQDENRFMKK